MDLTVIAEFIFRTNFFEVIVIAYYPQFISYG